MVLHVSLLHLLIASEGPAQAAYMFFPAAPRIRIVRLITITLRTAKRFCCQIRQEYKLAWKRSETFAGVDCS